VNSNADEGVTTDGVALTGASLASSSEVERSCTGSSMRRSRVGAEAHPTRRTDTRIETIRSMESSLRKA